MPTPLIGSAEYPAIRAAIDVSLDASVLPDATMALPIFVPAAIQDVLARDPSAETRTGGELTHVQNAAVYFAAARLVQSVPLPESEQFGDYRYTLGKVDREKKADQLRGDANAELEAVLSGSDAVLAAMPTLFAVATADRGA